MAGKFNVFPLMRSPLSLNLSSTVRMFRGPSQLSLQTDELVSNMSDCLRVITKNAKETLECFNEMAVRAAHSLAEMPVESKVFDDLSNWIRTMDQTVKRYADNQESLRQEMQTQSETIRAAMVNENAKIHNDVSKNLQTLRSDMDKAVEIKMEHLEDSTQSKVRDLSSVMTAELDKLKHITETIHNEGKMKDDQIRELRIMQDDTSRKHQTHVNEVHRLRDDINIHMQNDRVDNNEVKYSLEVLRARCTKVGDGVSDVERRLTDMELVEKSQHVYVKSVMEETNKKIIINEDAIKEMLNVLKSTDNEFQDWKRAMAYKVRGLTDGFHNDMQKIHGENKKRQQEQENNIYDLREDINELKERATVTETYCRESIESVMKLLAAVVTHVRTVESLPNIKDSYLACRKVQEKYEDHQHTNMKKTSKT